MIEHGEQPIDDIETAEPPVDDVVLDPAQEPSDPHVEALAGSIGPRPAGSGEEALAAGYLVEALAEAGLPAARLKTNVPRSGSMPDLLLSLLTLLVTVVTIAIPVLGLILLVIALALILADLQGILKLSRFLSTTESVNVLAIVPPAETEVRRVILTATLDTGKVGLLSRRHFGHIYPWLHLVTLGATIIALLTAIIVLVDSGSTPRPLLAVPALITFIVAILLAEREIRREASPGAITNASGIAALIEAGRQTEESPPRWLEIWLLGVGASAHRGGGMADFLSRNTFDPDTTYFVHLQSPGSGTLTVPKTVGAGLRTAPAAPLLAWIFDSISSTQAELPSNNQQRLAIESVAEVIHRAGYQSIVVAGVDAQGKVPFLDGDQDRPYQVQEEAIGEAVSLVRRAIDALDREVAARAMLARSTATVEDSPPVETTPPETPDDEV